MRGYLVMPALIIKGEKNAIFPLEAERISIGRDDSNPIKLDDERVSRQHCLIERKGNTFFLEDLGSSNGTFLNGEAIEKRVKIVDRDEISLGKTTLIFLIQNSALITESSIPHEQGRLREGQTSISQIKTRERDTEKPHLKRHGEQELTALYEVSRLISSVFDLEELLSGIIDVAIRVIGAERGFIVLKDEKSGELVPKAVRNRDAQKITISKTIAKKVFESGESVLTEDAMSDERFTGGKSIVDYHIRSCLCVPLKSKDKVFGFIHVDNKTSKHIFTEEDVQLLSAIGGEAGIVVENARLYEANLRAERLAAIGETITGLSHYIKNILTGVQGGETLVEMGMSDGKEELLKKGWRIVRDSNERISRLVLNMLDFSRESKPVFEKAGVNEIINEVASLLEETCRDKGIALKTKLQENLPQIELDTTGIHRSLLNLITNAVDAVSEGTGEIILTTKLTSSESPDKHFIKISVSDNGCGIPEEDIPKIYDIFHSTKGTGGTGLGLAVTKKIIEQHQGKIEVNSKPACGTTFTITLPIK